jgi:hypothetical protein
MRLRPGRDDGGGNGDDKNFSGGVTDSRQEHCPPPPSLELHRRRRKSYEVALGDGCDSCAVFPEADDGDEQDDDDLVECRRPFLDDVAVELETPAAGVIDAGMSLDFPPNSTRWLDQLILWLNQLIVHLTDGKRRGAISVGKMVQ